jgi:hypothetical protein
MATLPRLKPKCFYDIVVQVAIIRPGPIVGDMVHPYLNRRAGREKVVPLHPSLEPVLARTLGVPLFQEQLLRMAMVAAGFTGGQAEELRRAMGFKRSEKRMQQIEVQLRDGMARNGITGETAERIIQSITSFALYGFPESHAASFALLAYASAFLKVHYPAAFYTALLNNQPMGFYHPASLVKDAQRRGVRFHPIDVQQSDWLCRVEEDGAIRLGFMYVNGLRKEMGQTMAAFDRRKDLNGGPSLTQMQGTPSGGPSRGPSATNVAATMTRCWKWYAARTCMVREPITATSARTNGRGADRHRPLPIDRGPGAADGSASRRIDDARGYRGVECVHQRTAQCVMAGGASGSARWRAIRRGKGRGGRGEGCLRK